MKINVEVDCTPEEARRAVGLPDLTPLHDRYIAMMTETMEKGVTPELFETMTRTWGPMGEAGMSMWRGLFDAATKTPK
jgi:hypothetical protein